MEGVWFGLCRGTVVSLLTAGFVFSSKIAVAYADTDISSTAPGAPENSPVQACAQLNKIALDDHEILNKSWQQKLFSRYMGKCIDGELLKTIMADVSDFYLSRGHITTKPYLKQQSVADGQIEISVLKGTIENIVDATTKTSNSRIKTAFTFQKGEVLNLRDLETSLEMMNRPPSSDARFEIKPGNGQGTSIVEVRSRDISPYRLKIGMTVQEKLNDNNPYLTGELSVDNPLNINDIFTLRYNGNSVQKDYQSNRGSEMNYSFLPHCGLFNGTAIDQLFIQSGCRWSE